jgi:hypothetical protein
LISLLEFFIVRNLVKPMEFDEINQTRLRQKKVEILEDRKLIKTLMCSFNVDFLVGVFHIPQSSETNGIR